MLFFSEFPDIERHCFRVHCIPVKDRRFHTVNISSVVHQIILVEKIGIITSRLQFKSRLKMCVSPLSCGSQGRWLRENHHDFLSIDWLCSTNQPTLVACSFKSARFIRTHFNMTVKTPTMIGLIAAKMNNNCIFMCNNIYFLFISNSKFQVII